MTVRKIYGGPLAKTAASLMTPAVYAILGRSLVRILALESREYFARRGWNGKDPMGGPPIWRSFKWKLKGNSTLEITSTFYGMAEMASGDIPKRRMTWLTQQAKDRNPGNYELTKTEKKLGMKKTGRVSKGQRLPLIVPIQTEGGAIEFRTAPLKLGDAWIHPGIAKFTFFERALRKWKAECAQIVAEAMTSDSGTRR